MALLETKKTGSKRLITQVPSNCNCGRKFRVDGISEDRDYELDCYSAKVENTVEDEIIHVYTNSDELIASVAYNETYTIVEESTILCKSKIKFQIEQKAFASKSFDGKAFA